MRTSLRPKMLLGLLEKYNGSVEFCNMPPAQKRAAAIRASQRLGDPYTVEEVEGAFFRQVNDYANALDIARFAQTVIFSSEQAGVFSSIAESYTEGLDYKLPFQDVFIQFDKPVRSKMPMTINGGSSSFVAGILLRQIEQDTEKYKQYVARSFEEAKAMGFPDFRIQNIAPTTAKTFIQNVAIAVYESFHVMRFSWQLEATDDVVFSYIRDSAALDNAHWLKNMAIACVGYINCENVYLEKQGEVDEAVNRKREVKGKSRLEPYYVCRIRGVQYDSHATGEGSKHGIRYDVRGHFRRLETGKTIWVRPHQRGLQNELYVPKVYKVEKGSKPEWKA